MNPPAKRIGVLGSGQLGRMFAQAAQQMGMEVCVFSPDEADSPAGQVATHSFVAPYENLQAMAAFADAVDVVTLEFENIPSETLAFLEARVPVRPGSQVLHVTQNRLREKSFLRDLGIPVTPFFQISEEEDLPEGISHLGLPCVLKTAGFGYDGKGQRKITDLSEAAAKYLELGQGQCILEAFIDFTKEVSVIGARNPQGDFQAFPVFENRHRNHILDVTTIPARLVPELADEAVKITERIMAALDAVGLLCVEFFVSRDGRLMVNELAPRPHNSGHLTIEAFTVSQFEQQVRAVCGLSLIKPQMLQPAAMANLLGDVWANGEPDWAEMARQFPDVSLHLYGKHEARPGRKMGHLTAMADTPEQAALLVEKSRQALSAIWTG